MQTTASISLTTETRPILALLGAMTDKAADKTRASMGGLWANAVARAMRFLAALRKK